MKFIIASESLLRNIQLLSSLIEHNSTIPVLNNLLFEVNQNKLTLTSSNIEMTFSTAISVESTSQESFLLPARLLLDALKTLPEQPLIFTKKNETNTVDIVTNSGRYSIAHEPAEDFPKPMELSATGQLSIPLEIINNTIDYVMFAIGRNDFRPALNGMLCQLGKEKSNFVATDSFKLSRYTTFHNFSTSKEASFIMPKKALQVIKSIIQGQGDEIPMTLYFNDNNVQCCFGDTVLICKLINAVFPKYESIIPNKNANLLEIDRIIFLAVLKRLSVFSDPSNPSVKLNIKGNNLLITAQDDGFGRKAEETIDCDYVGEDMDIVFNSKYLIDIVSSLKSERIKVGLNHNYSAGLFYPATEKDADEKEIIQMVAMPINETKN